MTERHCLRCGAPYDEGATVCFTCGASIGELETPTQPVRAPRRPAPPAAPTAAPTAKEAPQGQDARVATVAPRATEAPAPGPARPLTVGSSYRAQAPVAPLRPAHGPRWPAVVALLVIVAALGVGGFFVARGLLAPKPVPTTTVYHDAQGRFSFAKPALWTVTPRANGALVADSTGANTITFTVATAQAGQSARAIADTLAAPLGLVNMPTVVIAGDQWEERTGQIIGQDGATRFVTLYVDIHASTLYTIQTSSPTDVSSSMNTLVYQPLLSSFSFR